MWANLDKDKITVKINRSRLIMLISPYKLTRREIEYQLITVIIGKANGELENVVYAK